MYSCPTSNVNPQAPSVGGVVMYMSSWTVPFQTAVTSNPIVKWSSGVIILASGP